MNRTRQILKKSAAAVLCASLILSGSSTAFAAGSYQETEKAALNKLTDGNSGNLGYLSRKLQEICRRK